MLCQFQMLNVKFESSEVIDISYKKAIAFLCRMYYNNFDNLIMGEVV